MIKRNAIILSVLLTAFVSLQPLSAYIDACYEASECEREWSIGGKGLYWKPHGFANEMIYSISENELQNDFLYGPLNPSYNWGFDFYIRKECPEWCSAFTLNWVHASFYEKYKNFERSNDPVINDFLTSHPGEASINYDRINLQASRTYLARESSLFEGFLGVSFLRLGQKKTNCFEYEAEPQKIACYTENSNLDGLMGELGVRGKVTLSPSWLYFLGEMGLMTGIGNRDVKVNGTVSEVVPGIEDGWFTKEVVSPAHMSVGAPLFSHNRSDRTICFTGIEYKFELGMEGEWIGLDWRLFGGYEGVFFHDLSLYFIPMKDNRINGKLSGIGFAGPFIGMSVSLPF